MAKLQDILATISFQNEAMNFPSLEGADDAQPEWWEEADANATLTEVDIAGESITENYERGHKVVVATAESYAYQRYTYADQPRIKSGLPVTALYAVWSVSSISAKIRFRDSAGTTWTSDATTAAAWTLLSVTASAPAGTYIQIEEVAAIGTAYFVPLGICMGEYTVKLPPRGLTHVYKDAHSEVLALDSATTGTWTDLDLTASTSPLAVMAQLNIFAHATAGNQVFFTRKNGSSEAAETDKRLLQVVNTLASNQILQLLDDGQILEYYLWDVSGGLETTSNVSLRSWWQWE